MTTAITLSVALAAWNNLLHLSPGRTRRLVVTGGVAAAAVAGGGWASWLWGSRSAGIGAGWEAAGWWGAVALTGSLVVAVAVARSVRLRPMLRDPRIEEMGTRRFAAHLGLRIPLISGLAEEVLFRGVAWAALAAAGGTWTALLGTSLAFGAWHVVVSAQQHRQEWRWVLANVALTALAGIGFGLIRIATGGIWAPAVVHAGINLTFALATWLASPRRLGRPG